VRSDRRGGASRPKRIARSSRPLFICPGHRIIAARELPFYRVSLRRRVNHRAESRVRWKSIMPRAPPPRSTFSLWETPRENGKSTAADRCSSSLAALSGGILERYATPRNRSLESDSENLSAVGAEFQRGCDSRYFRREQFGGGGEGTCAIPTLAGSLCVAQHGSPIKIHCVYIFRSWPLPPPSRFSPYALSLPRAACHSVKSLLFAGRVRDRRISLFQRNQRGPGALLPRPAG